MWNFEKLINNGCMDVVFLILLRKNWGVTLKYWMVMVYQTLKMCQISGGSEMFSITQVNIITLKCIKKKYYRYEFGLSVVYQIF